MASATFSAEYFLPSKRSGVHPATRPQVKWSAQSALRTIAEAMGSIAFLGIFGWEVWHQANQLLQYGTLMVAASLGGLF